MLTLRQTEEITYPDGERIEYSYNEAGQVDGVKGNFEYVKNIGYNKHAQRNHIEYGNGVVSDYTYSNTRRWLTELKTKNSVGEHLQNISYTFDTIGNVLSYTNDCSLSQGDVVAQQYTYDGLYQLTGVQGSIVRGGITSVSYSQTFTYDSIGNMTSKTSRQSSLPYGSSSDMLNYSFTYAYDADYAHRLKSAGGMYYNYNENGNVIGVSDTSYDKQYDLEAVRLSNTTWRYNYDITDSSSAPVKERIPGYERRIEYNDNNMMSHMSGTNEKETFYSYSDDNARVSKYVSSPYSESEQLTFNEYYSLFVNANNKWHGGDVYKSIMLGNSRLVTRIEQGVGNATTEWKKQRTFYYLADHLGSATLITTYKGDVYKRTEYTPYGEKWLESTTSSSSYNFEYGFTGKPLDEETGYYYFGARYYDPMRSVWTTSDPAMSEYFDGSKKGNGGIYNSINFNTYHYCGNNPIRYVDPNGENQPDMEFDSGLKFEYDKVNNTINDVPVSSIENGIAQTSTALYFGSEAIKSVGEVGKVAGAVGNVLGDSSTFLGFLSLGIDGIQAYINPSFSNIVDVGIDALCIFPKTAPIGIGASLTKAGIEKLADETVKFDASGTQHINNYINYQVSTGKGFDNWNIPTYGMFGIYTGIGY